MLTAAHTFSLRETLKLEGNIPPSPDIYIYALVPDTLPLLSDIPSRDTHEVVFPADIIKKYPKLRAVKHHIMLDNIGHYGKPEKPRIEKPHSEKTGFLYKKGKKLIPVFDEYIREYSIKKSVEDKIYLAHILAEIALDYRISIDEPWVDSLMRKGMEEFTTSQLDEYALALSLLYKIPEEKIKENFNAPLAFYGKFIELERLYKYGRSKLILRKCNLEFSEKNIFRTAEIIEEGSQKLGDWKSFLISAAETIHVKM